MTSPRLWPARHVRILASTPVSNSRQASRSSTVWVVVRPVLALARSLPLVVVAVSFLMLGFFGTGPLSVRLAVLFVLAPASLGAAVVIVLRSTALARPGCVHAGLGRSWLPVSSPGELILDVRDRRWAAIFVRNGHVDRAVITTAGPVWIGNAIRHDRAIRLALARLITAACIEAD
jgi:hypothetical protein